MCIVALPLIVAVVNRPESLSGFVYELARSAAVVGITILSVQFLLSARLRWIEKPFGLDMVLRFHRSMGIFAFALILLHPVLLAAGGRGWQLLYSPAQPWYVWLGRITLIALVLHIVISAFRKTLGLDFERWRTIHNVLALTVLLAAFIHSWHAGRDLNESSMQALWVALPGLALGSYVWNRIVRRWQLARRPYRVVEVSQETPTAWTIKLARQDGKEPFDYLPGQFHFLTLKRERGLHEEEHHFTISSSPTDRSTIASTIKESGDFTSTIGETRPNDTAIVQGPFGRFSYTLHPDERDLVFVAGGIGITPLMSMLRHIRDTQADRRVRLLFANRTEDEIAFRDEIRAMEADERGWLEVTHVLKHPPADWEGESGPIDREMLEQACQGQVAAKGFYLCGPPGLVRTAVSALRQMGVSWKHLHGEAFSFVDIQGPEDIRTRRRRWVTAIAIIVLLALILGATAYRL